MVFSFSVVRRLSGGEAAASAANRRHVNGTVSCTLLAVFLLVLASPQPALAGWQPGNFDTETLVAQAHDHLNEIAFATVVLIVLALGIKLGCDAWRESGRKRDTVPSVPSKRSPINCDHLFRRPVHAKSRR